MFENPKLQKIKKSVREHLNKTTLGINLYKMDPVLKKMTWKEGLNIQVWNAPPELSDLIATWEKDGIINSEVIADFLLAFVKDEEEVEKYFSIMMETLSADEQVWMAYPKRSSKKYKAKINRDSGWIFLKENDYVPVRQIAINEDWSALRFRKPEFIKTMVRKF